MEGRAAVTVVSNRWVTGAMTSSSVCIAMAELVALHTGQECEESVPFMSAQKWNCMPRKASATTMAKMVVRRCMCLI